MKPWLTIGVPTRDRPVELAGLLSLLGEQAPALCAHWRVQLLVADGGRRPAKLPAALGDAVDAAAVVAVCGGVSTGRNVLAQHAHGDVLVLLDDDVRPHAGSLAALAAAASPGTAVAGSVHGLGHRPGESSRLMAVDRTGYGVPARDDAADYAVSALLALPRDVYQRVAWDERFAAAHLDDVMYGLRLRRAGVALRHCPTATADHPPRDDNDRPELAGLRAVVVLTRFAGDRVAGAWLRCFAHVAWSHRRRLRDLRTAVAHYVGATWAWRTS
jgi:hypothetical protein